MPSAEEIEQVLATSDQHAAQAFLLSYLDKYQYARDTAAWFAHYADKDHWERMPVEPYHSIIADYAGVLPMPVEKHYADPDEYQKARKQWQYYQSAALANRIAAKMKAIAPTLRMPLLEAEMDADPGILWAGGEAYDLRTRRPLLDMANEPHLLSAGYAPKPGPMPIWDAINAGQWPESELREYALNVSSSILPGGSGKLLPNFKGDGNLAKTTRLMMLVDLLGSYAEQLPVQLLGSQQGHDEVYLRLKGKRLVYLDETPPAGKVAREKLKLLSGGGTLTGRAAYGRASVTFPMQHTLLLAGNDDLPLDDPAVQLRIRYLPITGDPAAIRAASARFWDNGRPSAAWKAEAPTVLWSLMERAANVMADPSLTDMPAIAKARFDEAVGEQDVVAQFVEACCEPGGQTQASTLHEEFVAWCRRNGIPQAQMPTSTKFGRRLTDLGYEVVDPKARVRYRPLRIRFAQPMIPQQRIEFSQN